VSKTISNEKRNSFLDEYLKNEGGPVFSMYMNIALKVWKISDFSNQQTNREIVCCRLIIDGFLVISRIAAT
jgi:hypothetical protein